MGILDRAIRNGIRRGVSDAIGNAVQEALEPVAAELVNKATDSLEQVAQQNKYPVRRPAGLEEALSGLQRSMKGYVNEAAKNIKECPGCGEVCSAEKKFCPSCGEKLPTITVAQGAVCPQCGKQNSVGTKFCGDCGAKLPAAVQEEQAAAQRDAAVLAQWSNLLPEYPCWNCGGSDFNLEEYEADIYVFAADFNGNAQEARNAVEAYRQLAMEQGFRMEGKYPSKDHLYKRVGETSCHIDFEHCFDGDSDQPVLQFLSDEPDGGYDYVKPEPKRSVSFKDLFR